MRRKEWDDEQKNGISRKERADIQTLMKLWGFNCRENHNGGKLPFSFKLIDRQEFTKREVSLCPDCHRLLTYGLTMRMKCPTIQTMCKKCETQCYHGEYKAKIREVMEILWNASSETRTTGSTISLLHLTNRFIRYAEDHACVPKRLLAQWVPARQALRRAGTAYGVDECE